MTSLPPSESSTSQELILQGAQLLREGKLVVFPTETVYGLGADASNPDAIAHLYQAKGRPNDHPVIVHIGDLEVLHQWAVNIPLIAYSLAEAFWPGPMTLILPKASHVPLAVTGGQDTVGIRMPAHPVAMDLLQAFGGGIAAPSANRFGRLSPTRVEDLDPKLLAQVGAVLDGGPCQVGIESTIIDCSRITPSNPAPVILRPGMILQPEIEELLGMCIHTRESEETVSHTRVSGDLPSHYAPLTPLELIDSEQFPQHVITLLNEEQALGVLAFSPLASNELPANCHWVLAPEEPKPYAQTLYKALQYLDTRSCDRIVVERPPQSPEWAGVNDRLTRAAAEKGEH